MDKSDIFLLRLLDDNVYNNTDQSEILGTARHHLLPQSGVPGQEVVPGSEIHISVKELFLLCIYSFRKM